MFSLPYGITILALAGWPVSAYKWPDPQIESAEDVLVNPSNFLTSFIQDCPPRFDSSIGAQWLRIAYHDMATHNVDDGTGGLDASIRFELDRPQNVGEGMQQSVFDFRPSMGAYTSFADVIAQGTVLTVAACGGPEIPYRAGRVDALVAGPATVPEPQQDLESHTKSFRRQGFTPTEMISLVACGHSLGGVRQVDFPTIVPEGVEVANFTTEIGFNNLVVRQYLDGSTANPLVVGKNTTTNSDLRIFSSDRNETMKSLASGSNFNTMCQSLIARMIDTVPKGVELTDVIVPIEHKVSNLGLFPRNGTLAFQVDLRFLSENPKRTVKLFWKEKSDSSSACSPSDCTADAKSSGVTQASYVAALRGITSLATYSFSTSVSLNTSISEFWFEADEKNGAAPIKIDNGGDGYQVDDSVLFDLNRSNFTIVGSTMWDNFVIAIKSASESTTKVSIKTFKTPPPEGPFVPTTQDVDLVIDETHPPVDGYTFYTNPVNVSADSIHVKAVLDGKEHISYFENFPKIS